MKKYGAVWIDVRRHLWGRQTGLERRCGRTVDSSGWRPSGRSTDNAAVDAGLSPAVRSTLVPEGWGHASNAFLAVIEDSIRALSFISRNVRISPFCARRALVYEPSLASSIALHARSLANSGAIWRAATALQNTEPPRHNGTPTGRRRPKPAKLAVNPILRDYVQDRLAGMIAAPEGAPLVGRRSCGTGDGPCIARTDAGQRPGARNRFLVAFGSTFPRMGRCVSVTKRSIRHFMCKAGERCAVN